MTEDLNAPLGLATKRKPIWARLPFGLVGTSLLGVLAVTIGVWQAFVRDPTGGEPTAVIKLDRSGTGIAKGDVAVAGGGAPEVAPKVAPAVAGEGEAAGGEAGKALEPITARQVPEAMEGQPLSTAPVARVSEKTRWGTLPKVAADGTRPLDVYARPVPRRPQSTPRVALVVGGLGISQTATQEALRVLSADVTLAFAPYGASLERWMQKARGDGHELLLQIPMEPFDYPDNDPGPQTLVAAATAEVNTDRLLSLLGRMTNYVGVVNYMGARFTADPTALGGTMKDIGGRGLLYLDDGSSSRSTAEATARAQGTAFARADLIVDEVPREEAIAQRLGQLEQIARAKGVAVGNATALPVTLKVLQTWVKGLEGRGLVLVPVSSVVRRP